MTLEELQIILEVNNKQLVDGLAKAKTQLNDFNRTTNKTTNSIFGSFKKLGVMIAGLGIGKLIAKSINDGMESIESESLFEITMGDFSKEFRTWSEELQTQLGLNAYEVRKNAALFHMLGLNMGVSADVSSKMSKSLTQIAYDMSSFRNQDPERVFNALQGAMVGNTEALRSMGIVLTQAMVKQEAYAQGIAATGSELTNAQKAMATYSLICKQTAADQGDLSRTISSPSNQLRILKSQLQQLSIEFGKAFTPIMSIVLPMLNALISKLIQATKIFAQFTQALFGKSASSSSGGTSGAITDLGDLSGSYDDVAASAKKAAKQVLSFDEVNTLSDKSSDNDNLAGMEVPQFNTDAEVDTEEIPAKVQEVVDKIKAKLEAFKEWFNQYKDIIIAITGGIIAGFVAFKTLTFLSSIPAMFTAIGAALSVLVSPIGIASIAIGGLAAIFIYLWRTNEEFRDNMKGIWEEISAIFTNFMNNTIKPFVEFFYSNFLQPIGEGFSNYMLPMFADLFVQLGEIFAAILDLFTSNVHNILEGVKPILELISYVFVDCMRIISEFWEEHGQKLVDKFIEVINNIKETSQKIWDEIFQPIIVFAVETLRKLWDEHLSGMVEKFLDFVGKLVEGAMDIYNEFIAPLVQWIVETFGPAFVTTFNFIVEQLGIVLGIFADVFGGIFDILGGLIDFLVGVFTGDWEQAWDGIKQIFSGVWDIIKGIVGGLAEYFQNTFNFIFEFCGKIWDAIVKTIVDYVQFAHDKVVSILEFLKKGISNIWNTIKDVTSAVWNAVRDIIVGVWEKVSEVTKTVLNTIKNVVSTIFNAVKDVITDVFNKIKDTITNIWNNISNTIKNILSTIQNTITNTFNTIKNTVANVFDTIKNTISNAWNAVKNVTSNVLNTVGNVVSNIFNGIKTTISNIASYIGNGFKSAWSNAWNGVVNVFKNIWNGLTDFIKAPLNFMIDMLNKLINGLNHIKLPSWVPGIGGMGINIPNIPRLAQGGIVDKPTIAQIGEAGPEMIVPLKNTDFVTKMANAVGQAVYANLANNDFNNENDTASNQPIILRVGEMDFGKAAINAINKVTKVNGQCLIRT